MKKFKRHSTLSIFMILILTFCFTQTAFADAKKVEVEKIATYEVATGNISVKPMELGVSTKSATSYPAILPANLDLNASISDLISPNAIIGGDGREEIDPYIWGIAEITTYWKDGTSGNGTAFVFANDALLTAAHCVYSAEKGGWCDYVDVECCRQSSGTLRPYGTLRSTYIHTNTTWINSQSTDYDYAVIEVGSQIGLQTGVFGFSASSSVGQTVTITGYPTDHQHEQWTMSGPIKSVTTNLVRYEIDTVQRQSGSPVYTNFIAVAVHTGYYNGTNHGTRFTASMVDWFATFR